MEPEIAAAIERVRSGLVRDDISGRLPDGTSLASLGSSTAFYQDGFIFDLVTRIGPTTPEQRAARMSVPLTMSVEPTYRVEE